MDIYGSVCLATLIRTASLFFGGLLYLLQPSNQVVLSQTANGSALTTGVSGGANLGQLYLLPGFYQIWIQERGSLPFWLEAESSEILDLWSKYVWQNETEMKNEAEMRDGDILVVAWCQMSGTRCIFALLQFD